VRAIGRLAPFLAVLGLAGCPLPQPLPDYPAGTVTPPRLLVDSLINPPATDAGSPVVFVPAGCTTTAPSFKLSAKVNDPITMETIESRWFVNYDARSTQSRTPAQLPDTIPPNQDTSNLIREVPPFTFYPYDFEPPLGAPPQTATPIPSFEYPYPGILRVVELVVSNGFDPSPVTTTSELPNRKTVTGFETQVFRWVFLSVPESSSVRCP
jgi:hypothetical protein